ncbi:MAG: GFA family protein [Acidimicrobiia bacterium]
MTDSSERTAQCACGDTEITAGGEPILVLRCHCDYCQRRGGNVAATAAWFTDDQIVSRATDVTVLEYEGSDPQISYHFCTRCGSTVYWTFPDLPGVTVVGVGCFFDPSFPAPTIEHHAQNRHPWIAPVPGAEQFEQMAPPEVFLAAVADKLS